MPQQEDPIDVGHAPEAGGGGHSRANGAGGPVPPDLGTGNPEVARVMSAMAASLPPEQVQAILQNVQKAKRRKPDEGDEEAESDAAPPRRAQAPGKRVGPPKRTAAAAQPMPLEERLNRDGHKLLKEFYSRIEGVQLWVLMMDPNEEQDHCAFRILTVLPGDDDEGDTITEIRAPADRLGDAIVHVTAKTMEIFAEADGDEGSDDEDDEGSDDEDE